MKWPIMTYSLISLNITVPPLKFVSAVARTYQDLVVVLKIEKEVVELPQTVGVRQGDNMAPVLFLFLMSAFAETLEAEWK